MHAAAQKQRRRPLEIHKGNTMRYAISYDLRKPGRDYKTLWDELNRLGAKRMLKSHYVVRRINTSAKGMRDHLAKFIDANDGLLVIELDGAASAWRNLESTPKDV